ncbi:MAG: hypothetical protein ABFD04_02610 [Syntrophomonas sp.]
MNLLKITEYLKSNVIGTVLATDELAYQLEDGKLEGVYSDQVTFSNLFYSESGLHFDMFVVAKETIYELDDKLERGSINRDYSGVSVFRYELAKRSSSGEVTGVLRLISTTVKNHTAEAIVYGVYDIALENNELRWREQQLLYRDQSSDNDNSRAVAFDSRNRFYHEDGKLRFEYNGSCFDVDTVTLAKTPSKDVFPQFLAKEK